MAALVGYLLILAAFVCGVIIIIDAFRNEIWKGVLSLICGLYWLYYALLEFEHESKWLIVILAIVGGAAGGALIR